MTLVARLKPHRFFEGMRLFHACPTAPQLSRPSAIYCALQSVSHFAYACSWTVKLSAAKEHRVRSCTKVCIFASHAYKNQTASVETMHKLQRLLGPLLVYQPRRENDLPELQPCQRNDRSGDSDEVQHPAVICLDPVPYRRALVPADLRPRPDKLRAPDKPTLLRFLHRSHPHFFVVSNLTRSADRTTP